MPTDTAERVRDDELLLTRSFDAPVALVFRMWADAAHLRRWWGPKAFTCTAFDLDFRPGGAWRACIVSERYGESWMSGHYREIEPERRIVFTFTWEAHPDDPGSDTLVTVTLARAGRPHRADLPPGAFRHRRRPRQPHRRLERVPRPRSRLCPHTRRRRPAMITVTAFKWVPPFAQGLSRDLRVRWALEEAGLPYRLRQIDFPDQDSPEHRARQPFGQVPVLDDDGLVLFESGAIVLHIAEKSPALLPLDPAARPGPPPGSSPRSTPWSRWSSGLAEIDFFHADEPWAHVRRPQARSRGPPEARGPRRPGSAAATGSRTASPPAT